jgi:DNA-binding PadR family transcriptional regulator
VRAEWQLSENRQRVREYRLTADGRRQLAAERSKWERFSAAMAGIMNPPLETKP